jgi:putative tryptophan/tyrosine transport system substrate-binding protein
VDATLRALFVGLAIVAAGVAFAQPAKVARIGFLTANDLASLKNRFDAFRAGMKELGYVEGRNVVYEYRGAGGRPERLAALAAELERLDVHVILTAGPSATRGAKAGTRKTPIVMAFDADPIASGFVASLSRPGGNITGLSILGPEISAKQIDVLKQVVPKLTRLAILGDTREPANARSRQETERAAQRAGIEPKYFDVAGLENVEAVFGDIRQDAYDALIVLAMPAGTAGRGRLARLAEDRRLPTIYPWPEFVDSGGLMTYSVNQEELYRRAATYVDRIVRGTKAGDLPIEQAYKFDLVINLKAAKAIGLPIPKDVLTRAERIVQ